MATANNERDAVSNERDIVNMALIGEWRQRLRENGCDTTATGLFKGGVS